MKNIVICIPNTLLSNGVVQFLKDNSAINTVELEKVNSFLQLCDVINADILLVEVRPYEPYTLDEWLKRFDKLHVKNKLCKTAVIVDENSSPILASEVIKAKKENKIDVFFFGSVDGNYFRAVMDSL